MWGKPWLKGERVVNSPLKMNSFKKAFVIQVIDEARKTKIMSLLRFVQPSQVSFREYKFHSEAGIH